MEDFVSADSSLETNNVELFMKDFNTKFGVSTSSLEEVLDICDALFSDLATNSNKTDESERVVKLEKKLEKERAKNAQFCEEIKNLNVQNTELQNSLDSLSDDSQRLKDEIACLEQKLNISQKKLQEANLSTERASNTRKSIQSALDSLSEMCREQISEVSALSSQRNSLIKVVQKQKQVIDDLENALNESHQKKDKCEAQSVKIPESYIDSCEVLATVYKSVSESLPSTAIPELIKIRDNSEEAPMNRVESLMHLLCSHSKSLDENAQKSKENEEDAKEQQKKCEKSVVDVLTMFEEELSFMQSLSTSSDIQNCMLYRPEIGRPLLLDQDSKSFLLRKCAQNAKFIQDVITSVKIEDIQTAIDCAEPNHIFELLTPNILSTKLSQFMDKMDGREDSTTRMLYNLFAAQAFSNDLLQNHCVELRQRYDLMQKELNQARQEIESSTKIITKVLKKLNRMKNAEESIRNSVSEHFEINPESSTERIVKDALESLSQSVESASQLYESFSEEQFKEQLDEKVNKAKEQFDKEIKEVQAKTDDLQKENAQLKKEREEEKEEVQKIKSDFANKQSKLEEMAKKYNEQSEELTKRIEELVHKNEVLEMSHQKDKEELEQTKAEFSDLTTQFSQARRDLETGKQKRNKLKQQIEFLETTNRKVAQTLKEKSRDLRHEYETAIQDMNSKIVQARLELESTQDSFRNLLSKNEDAEEQLAILQVAKNQLELKLKSLEDKKEQEKSTMQAQLEAQLHSVIAQSRERIGTLEEEEKVQVLSFSHKFERYGVKTVSTGLSEFLESLEDEMERRYKAQTVYEETVADLTKVQHLLSLPSSSNIYDAVYRLYSEKETLDKQHELDIENCKKYTDMSEEKINEQRKVEAQLESLRKWEEWGRVLHRIVCERTSSTYSSDKLRLSLEEAILAAVSHRSILNKLDSLREQKKALLSVDRDILEEPLHKKCGWLPLISLCISCRRMQKQAGVINIVSQTPSTIELSSSFDSKNSLLSSSQNEESVIKYPPLFTNL